MATEPAPILQPGVTVIEKLATPTASFFQPTLIPCVVGPGFEVTDVLNSDNTINSGAKFGAYSQLPLAIAETSFPAPRGNADELTVVTDSIRPFLLHSGLLDELLMNPGEAFLTASHVSSKAAINTAVFSGGTGLAIVGTTLVFALDQPVDANVSDDITITFAAVSGGSPTNLTSAQAAAQINAAVGQTVAVVLGTAPSDYVQIQSPLYGALGSVTIRAGGSANTLLQIGYHSSSGQHEERVVGSGYMAQDLSNGTTQSPWITFFQGAYYLDGVATAFPVKAGLINILTNTFVDAAAAAITFTGSGATIPLQPGDLFYADGIQAGGGEVMTVQSNRFRIGIINAALSIADSNGRYEQANKVYTTVTFGLLYDPAPFSPSYAYYRAENIDWTKVVATAADITGSNTGNAAKQAFVIGTTITFPAALTGLTLHYTTTINGVDNEEIYTFTSGASSIGGLVTLLGSSLVGITPLTSSSALKLETTLSGEAQRIVVHLDGTANTVLGFSNSVDTDSNTDTAPGTQKGRDVEFDGVPPVVTTVAQVFSTTTLTGTTLTVDVQDLDTGGAAVQYSHTFVGEVANIGALVSALTGDVGFAAGVTASSASGQLALTAVDAIGDKYSITIDPASTAYGVGKLQFTSGQTATGSSDLAGHQLQFQLDNNPHIYTTALVTNSLPDAVAAINTVVGVPVASITGGNQLTITSPLSGLSSAVAILSGDLATTFGFSLTPATGTGRPFPDAYLDNADILHIQSEILRDQTTGYPLDQATETGDSLYIQYTALRLDITAVAANAAVISISDINVLESNFNPITSANPFGLGMFLAMTAAPSFLVKGLGVDEVSGTSPFGTSAAYARALSLLQGEEVYAMALLTQDPSILSLANSHVNVMSEPDEAGERITFNNYLVPTRANPTIAVNGLQANSTTLSNQIRIDTNPSQGLINAGINPALAIPVSANVYLQFEDNSGNLQTYNVSSVSGTLVNLNTTFTSTQNTDGFFSTTPLTETVIDAPYTLAVRGTPLVVPGTNPPLPDLNAISVTVSEANAALANRRVYSTFPDTIVMPVSGISMALPGFYANCSIVGMIASYAPQQGFTNLAIPGITGVQGFKFTRDQLNQMAGGGTYILKQDSSSAPVSSRHQLSTDTSSIETRELSITKSVDFVAKFNRAALRSYIGTQNIDPDLLDSISTVLQGLLELLVTAGVLNGYQIISIAQDINVADTVLATVILDLKVPCNYIQTTMEF